MSPDNFIFPVIKAVVGFREPENILKKLLLFMENVASAATGGSPRPQAPEPFFRSKYHLPLSSPVTSNAYTALVFSTSSSLKKPSILAKTCNIRQKAFNLARIENMIGNIQITWDSAEEGTYFTLKILLDELTYSQ